MKQFNLNSLLLFAFAISFSGTALNAGAQSVSSQNQLLNSKDWNFVENKGQLADKNGDTHSDIKFYSHDGGPEIYCRPGMISFVFKKFENAAGQEIDPLLPPQNLVNPQDRRRWMEDLVSSGNLKTVTSRTDLVIANSDLNALISGQDQQAYYENYYTSYTPECGVNKVHTFKTIVYSNIYPGIDMQLHALTGGIEYSFIVHSGARVGDIQLKWNGLESTEALSNGGMHYSGNMIDMTDSKPVSYITKGVNIPSSFVKNENNISFKISSYDHTQSLTIDPTLSWGTYMGGGSRNWGEAVWTDNTGNVLMCGPSTSPTSNISTSGAFQTSSGTYDAFLAKFSKNGSIQWCTYYGGSGYNDGWGLSTDALGNIYMGGATSSSSGIATSGSFQSSYGGGPYGGYGAKFRPNGSRVWGTYYGSTGNDQVLYIATDMNANVFLLAWATTATGLASSGAYQTSNGGGTSGTFDAGLAKYDSSGSKQIWSTYYGGSQNDEVSSVATDINGNSLICGETSSSSQIASSGAYQPSLGGGYDAFVASFSPTGSLNWSTYEGGTGTDIGWGISADQFGNVYVNGQTGSSKGIAYNIPSQLSLAGTSNSFLSKFNSKGLMLWSTYYGGGGTDIGNNLGLDPTGSIFVAGSTTSSSGIAMPGAYLTSLQGSQNAFFGKFSPAGHWMYGSYYGGGTDDNAIDIHADAIGNTYMSGTTSSTSGIATSGGYITSYASASDNAFLAAFNFKSYSNDAGIVIMPPGACAGKQTITAMLENFGTKNLTSATIGWSLNGKIQTPISWSGSLSPDSIVSVKLGTLTFAGGTDTFKVWTSKPNGVVDSLPTNDTLLTKVIFVAYPKVDAGGPKTVCAGSSVLLGPSSTTNGVLYSWTSDSAGFSSSVANPTVSPKGTTEYYLTETTILGGCAATDSAKVTVGQIPTPRSGGVDTICYGGGFTLGLKPFPGHYYSWSSVPNDTFTSDLSNPTVYPTVTTTYYETEQDSATGCLAYGHTSIIVRAETQVNAGGNQKICPAASVAIGNSSVTGHSYSWVSVPKGFTSTKSNPTVSPNAVTTYYYSDKDNSTGCISGDTVVVSFNPLPAAATGSNQTVCAGSNALIGATAVSGDSYSWKSNPAGYTSTSSNPTVIPTANTSYILTETITATGCSKTDTAMITTKPQPVADNGGTKNICLGDLVQLGNGVTTGHTYLWSSVPKGFSSSNGYPTVTPTISTKYYLIETISASGCSRKDSTFVIVNSVTADAGTDKAVCQGTPDTLGTKAVTGKTYAWTSNPTGFTSASANPAVTPSTTTIYYLKVTDDATTCSANDTVVIFVNPLPPARTGTSKSICSGTSTYIGDTSSASDSFSWVSVPVGFVSNSDNPEINPGVTTIYYLTETNMNTGCAKTNSVTITTKPLPDSRWTATFTGKTTYLHAVDSSLNYNAYYWNLGDGDTASGHLAKHVYVHSQPYSIRLSITGSNGCLAAADSLLSVLTSGFEQNKSNDFAIDLFPNPFRSSTSLQYNLENTGKVKIILFDITGKQVGVIKDETEVAGNYKIDISSEKYQLKPGMYLLQFIKDDQFVSKNLIKM